MFFIVEHKLAFFRILCLNLEYKVIIKKYISGDWGLSYIQTC